MQVMNGVLTDVKDKDIMNGTFVFPEGVTSIGACAFYDCISLTSIIIPESITSIGEFAFTDCSSLTSVTIPESITNIGKSVFSHCSSLTSITIPESITSIGEATFNDCSSLTSITIPEGVTSIGDDAFYGCSSLNSITLPESITSIGDSTFWDCSSLTSITIPEGVTSIEYSAFWNCGSLTSITLPESITNIERSAFTGCSSLTSITIPEGVTSIEDYAFWNCSSLTSITLPESITNIERSAFASCRSLTSINLPEGVTSIGDCAFTDCKSLTSITIPEGVTSIGENAFTDCTFLTSITIPKSVTSIGKFAFKKCSIKELHTPWGSCEIKDNSTDDIIQNYLYLYANSILKEKYSSLDDFLSSNDFIYEFFDGAIIYHTNAIIKFKNLFYKMRKDFDIPNGLFNRMSVEMTEKFDLKTWNHIKNIFDWRDSPEMTEAFNEMIAVFGLFEEDNEKEKRILDFIDLFQKKSYIIYLITNDDYSYLVAYLYPNLKLYFEKKETTGMLLKETTDIPTEFQPYLKVRLSESEIKKIKKLTGTYGKQINEFLKYYYQVNIFKDYQLKKEYLDQEDIKKRIFFKTDWYGHLTYHSLHRIFDGCELKFNPDFYHFLMDNLEFILHDEKLQSEVKNIQKNFEKMKKHYLFQSGTTEITLKQALDYLENITFDYHDRNYELALDVKRAGVNDEEAFLYYQKVFEENDVRKLSSLIKRSHIYEIDGYTIQAELLRKDDSFGMLVGEVNYTDCCQAFGDLGHNCMAHAVSSDDGGIFVTRLLKDGEWILLTESWDWQNNNIYCHDNIEGTPYFKKDERLKKAVAEVYRLDGEAIIEKSKEEVLKYIKTRRKVIEKSSLPNKEKELELLRELEQREVIRLVTVGSGNDDLGLSRYFQRSIQVNQEQIIASQRFTLENFQPVNYNSNQPYFDETHGSYTDSGIKQYMIAGSIEELCLGKLEPLVPIYRDERRVILEEKENIRNYTVNKIKNMEKEIYPKEMYQYQTSHQDDFSDSNIYLGEDWYLIYEEKEDNGIYISDLVKTTPTLGDEIKDQNQEIMKVIYDLVRKYDYIEADLKEDTSYLLYLINKKLGYFEQIGEDISYPFQNRNQQKEITEQEQEDILKQMKEIKKKKNPELIMHHITFQKGKLFQLEEEAIKHR